MVPRSRDGVALLCLALAVAGLGVVAIGLVTARVVVIGALILASVGFLLAFSGPRSSQPAGASLPAPNVALVTLDADGRVTSFNAGAEKLLGASSETVVGSTIAAAGLGAGEEGELSAELHRAARTGKSSLPRRFLVARRDGTHAETLLAVFPLEDGCAAAILVDLAAAEGPEERRVRFFESAPVGLLRTDAAGNIELVNRVFAEWVGRRAEMLEGTDITRAEFLPEGIRSRIQAVSAIRSASAADAAEEELTIVGPGGQPRSLLAHVIPRREGGADAILLDGSTRRRLVAERDSARAALAAARQTAVQTIESTTQKLKISVKELVDAVELAKDEKSGPIERAAAEEELKKTGKKWLAQFQPCPETPLVPRVLLVDDNDENRELLAHMLKSRGADVVAAGSGREALAAASEDRFDVVLLDVQMPEMDGYEVVHRLRALPGGERLAVLALTALTAPEVREHCRSAGMDGFVGKPVSLGEIGEILKRWGRGRELADGSG